MNIRRTDKLSKDDWRAILVTIVILAIAAIGLFSSCTPHNYPNINRHSVIFEPGNNDTYLFSDHHIDSLYFANRVIPNGYVFADGSSYTFSFQGNILTVTVGKNPDLVKYKPGALSKVSEFLEVKNATFSKELDPHGFFIIEYPWPIID